MYEKKDGGSPPSDIPANASRYSNIEIERDRGLNRGACSICLCLNHVSCLFSVAVSLSYCLIIPILLIDFNLHTSQ